MAMTLFDQPAFEHKQCENNAQSEQHYTDNLPKFNGQCKTILEAMQRGERITAYDAMVAYGIGHLARRICDLREGGIDVKDEFIKDADGKTTRYKVYFL